MADEWTLLENLLLVQAVYKYGEDSWLEIATKLARHSLLKRNANFFNQQSCSVQYGWLLQNVDIEISQDTPAVVRIAEKLYMQRVNEITQAITRDENDFQQLVNEIDSIRSGDWDEKLTTTNSSNDSNSIYPSNAQVDDCLMKEYIKQDDMDTEQSQTTQNEQETESCKIEEPISNNMHIAGQNDLIKDHDTSNHLDEAIENNMQQSDVIHTPQQDEQAPQSEPTLDNEDNESQVELGTPIPEQVEAPFEPKDVDTSNNEDQSQTHVQKQNHPTPISESNENNSTVDVPMPIIQDDTLSEKEIQPLLAQNDTEKSTPPGQEPLEPMLEAQGEPNGVQTSLQTEDGMKANVVFDMVMDLTSEPNNSDDKTEPSIIINDPQTEPEENQPAELATHSNPDITVENVSNDSKEEMKETTTEAEDDTASETVVETMDESEQPSLPEPEQEQEHLNEAIPEMTKETSPGVVAEDEPVTKTDLVSEPAEDEPVTKMDLASEPVEDGPATMTDLTSEPVDDGLATKTDLTSEPAEDEPVEKAELVSEPAEDEPVTKVDLASELVEDEPVTKMDLASELVEDEPVTKMDLASELVEDGPATMTDLTSEPAEDEPVKKAELVSEPAEDEPVTKTDLTSEFAKDHQQDTLSNSAPEEVIKVADPINKSANDLEAIKETEVEVTEGLEPSVADELKSNTIKEAKPEEPPVTEHGEPNVTEVPIVQVTEPDKTQPEVMGEAAPEMTENAETTEETVPEITKETIPETPEKDDIAETEETVPETIEKDDIADKPEPENSELEVTENKEPESTGEPEAEAAIDTVLEVDKEAEVAMDTVPEVDKELEPVVTEAEVAMDPVPEVDKELEPVVTEAEVAMDPVPEVDKELEPVVTEAEVAVDAVSEVNKEPEPVVTEVPKETVPENIKENQQSETCKESEIDIEGDTTNDVIPETAEEPDITIVEDAAPITEPKEEKKAVQDIPEPIIIDDDPDDTAQEANIHPKRPIDAIDIKEEPTHKRSRLESESPAMSSSPHPDDDSAVSTPARHSKDDIRQKTWQKTIILLWQEIANHKNGTMFMNPIKKSNAPLYYRVVKQPLDLKSIKNRVRDGIIKTTAEFERDIILMLTNSLMYNKEGTEIYQMAFEMLQDVQEQIRLFKSADVEAD